MQDSTVQAEASISAEHVRNGPNTNLNRTVTARRKAAKRTFPWDLTADDIQLGLPRPQDEDIRATKRPRLEELLLTSTDEARAEDTSYTTAVALPIHPAAAAAAAATAATAHHADSYAVMDAPLLLMLLMLLLLLIITLIQIPL
jgi:hypothetical protein